ncbi:hypothetical protein B0T19DRAFT_404843 [Cercophora scortea]|uniref:Uncharacterized protein n=1 Tax=Cercophora scortea TaxID=314031 RepID=A0AAE0I8N3_9PEZI|nr:hypothetical protein B0T19DRAFT_404843 [Cercophora scortea]
MESTGTSPDWQPTYHTFVLAPEIMQSLLYNSDSDSEDVNVDADESVPGPEPETPTEHHDEPAFFRRCLTSAAQGYDACRAAVRGKWLKMLLGSFVATVVGTLLFIAEPDVFIAMTAAQTGSKGEKDLQGPPMVPPS